MNKKSLSLFLFVAICACTFAQTTTFKDNLTDQEKQQLNSGKIVIRSISSLKKVCLFSQNQALQKLFKTAKDLDPSYIAEIIQVRPYKGNENLLDNLQSIILNIPSYAGIPYYSEHAEAWYELYSSAKITSQTVDGQENHILADLEMEPFGIINTKIDTLRTDDYFYYESTNLNKLRYYDKFTCVSDENMKSLIVVYRDGDNWILYGIGAVDAPSVFFLRDRIETSFMNRIKTFCSYIFSKL